MSTVCDCEERHYAAYELARRHAIEGTHWVVFLDVGAMRDTREPMPGGRVRWSLDVWDRLTAWRGTHNTLCPLGAAKLYSIGGSR